MPSDFYFLLTGCNGDRADGELDLDDGQFVFDPDNKQICIHLTGKQVDQLRKWPSAMSRLARPPAGRGDA